MPLASVTSLPEGALLVIGGGNEERLVEIYCLLDAAAEALGRVPAKLTVLLPDVSPCWLAASWARSRGASLKIHPLSDLDAARASGTPFISLGRTGGKGGRKAPQEPAGSPIHSELDAAAKAFEAAGRERLAAVRGLRPTDDGTSYINVYSKGSTWLGRALSNFTAPELGGVETSDGRFASVEGYWFWLGSPSHPDRDALRELSGWAAKSEGGRIRKETVARLGTEEWFLARPVEETFRARIASTLGEKLAASPRLLAALAESNLPLVHFYAYGVGSDAVVVPGEAQWVIEEWELLRVVVKG